MSKFTEEWQRVRKDIGHMVGVMESMAAKYGECTDIEEIAKNKGFAEGYNLGIKKQKAEICEGCNHKVLAEQCCQYADVLNVFDKLEIHQQKLIADIMLEMVAKNGGGK